MLSRGWLAVFAGMMLAAVLLSVGRNNAVQAQEPPKVTGGFDTSLPAIASGEELSAQSDLWMMEVTFKPMRMIVVELTDPKTGKRSREYVWYLVYKAVNRLQASNEGDADVTPVNVQDPPPSEPLFVPEFTLVSDDNGVQEIYHDAILPEAQAAIEQRERRKLLNSVEIVQPLPTATPAGAVEESALYGVAMFRGIDQDSDFFTLYMGGFSNGYKLVTGPDGNPLFLRKTIVQEYWRPGDRFDLDEREIRQKGNPRWIYRADEVDDNTQLPAESSPETSDAPAAGENTP